MTPNAFHSLVAALIRVGLLLALAILLMAENAQAHAASSQPAAQSAATYLSKASSRVPAGVFTSSSLRQGW